MFEGLAMDLNKFDKKVPGKIVPISTGEHAFVPDPLPPKWSFPVRLWPLLGEVKQQLGILEGISRNLPNPAILLRPLENREAIKSSRLEGTYATATDLLLFEIEPRKEYENGAANDHREVFNYRVALQQGISSDLPLSLRLLRNLHETLLLNVRGHDRTPGRFRQIQVAIGSDHRFIPPPPELLLECLDPLEKYLHNQADQYDPLVNCFLIHYQFETIHPFIDGNGRIGRLLLALMLKQRCGLSKPWLFLSEYYEKQRERYVDTLFKVSTSADWDGWIEFCLQGALHQTKDAIQRCDRLRTVREEYLKTVGQIDGNTRLNQIVEKIFYSPFIRIVNLQEQLSVSYPTAKADVDRLVQAGILKDLDNISPRTAYAPEIFNIAYDDME
jgi:Fic family protein